MSTDVARRGSGAVAVYQSWTPEGLQEAIETEKKLREVVLTYYRSAMIEGHHYYRLDDDGKKKPALSKEGALNLCSLFKVKPESDQPTETYANDGHYTVRYRTNIISVLTGEIVATGDGMCSTRESKYAYRWVYDREIPVDVDKSKLVAAESKRKDGSTYKRYKLPNPDLADQYNTVLKMSEKRSIVDGVLKLPLASELFTQDLEEEIQRRQRAKSGGATEKNTTQVSRTTSTLTPTSTEKTVPVAVTAIPPADIVDVPLSQSEELLDVTPQDVTGEVVTVEATVETVPAPKSTEKLTRQEAIFAIQSRLHDLVAGRSDATARREKIGFCVAAFGPTVNTWVKVTGLPLSSLRTGAAHLLALELPRDPQAPEADVPDFPPPSMPVEDSTDTAMGAPIESQEAGVKTVEGEILIPEDSDRVEEPTDTPIIKDSYVDQGDLRILSMWAEMLGEKNLVADLLKHCPMGESGPLVTLSEYQMVKQSVIWALQQRV